MSKILKLFILFAIISLPVGVTSCDSDNKENDDKEYVQNSEIVGTWNTVVTDEDGSILISYTFRNSALFTATYFEETDNIEESALIYTGKYTYSPDLKHLSIDGVSTEGQQLKLSVKCEIAGKEMTWTETDGTVTVFTK